MIPDGDASVCVSPRVRGVLALKVRAELRLN